MPAGDYYELLGVGHDATDEEIKRAYRRKARELHPDRTGGDAEAEARFKEVTLAYEVLRDPERRRRYDMYGPDGAPEMGDVFGSGFGFGDIFDAFFGGARRGPTGPVRGADAEAVIEISFRDAVFGTRQDVTISAPVACDTCGGSGARPGTTAVRCPDCNGSGELRRVRQSILGQVVTAVPCQRCGGTGEAISSPCPDCRGEGRRVDERVYTVDVPAGVDNGAALRLPGRGPVGPRGGPPGDLYVRLSVRPDDRFGRDGWNLHARLHLPMTSAALGTVVPFETLDGTEELSIPPGTQSGKVLRLRGRGVPHVRGRGRGDLLIEVVVDTPTELTDEQQEILRRLAAARGEAIGGAQEGILGRIRSAFG